MQLSLCPPPPPPPPATYPTWFLGFQYPFVDHQGPFWSSKDQDVCCCSSRHLTLKLSTSTCIKEMWRVVADLEDRGTDLCHSSMHKFVGPYPQPEKGPECITIVCTRNPNPNSIGNYRKGCTTTQTNALEMRAKDASNSYKCITRLIVTGIRQYYAALVWSCTNFVHSARTAHPRRARRPLECIHGRQ